MITHATGIPISNLAQDGALIQIEWQDGHRSTFHSLWLRDNCPMPTSRHPNGQRILESARIPAGIQPQSAALRDGQIEIIWAPDGHLSRYDPAWLRAHCPCDEHRESRRRHPILWSADLTGALPEASYPRVAGRPATLRRWLAHIRDYGFAILHDVPVQSGMVTKVVELFGYVRETNYGRLFDVRAVADPTNLAYTGLALSNHTDNPYRDPVPTLQLLHCLASSVSGGENTLVDGFQVAAYLRQHHPEPFDRLTRTPLQFQYADMETELAAETPMIRLDSRGQVSGIRVNNRSLQPLDLPLAEIEPFYDAYRTFAGLLADPRFQVRIRLEPGDLICFDNERVLHGRTGYESSGIRHLQGCYADRDGLLSRLAVLSRS